MQATVLPARGVVYVMDAYCGWCWASLLASSSSRLPIATACRSLLSVAAFSPASAPGLSRPTRTFPRRTHASRASRARTLARLYQRVLEEGRLVMNSSDAGAALAALRDLAPQKNHPLDPPASRGLLRTGARAFRSLPPSAGSRPLRDSTLLRCCGACRTAPPSARRHPTSRSRASWAPRPIRRFFSPTGTRYRACRPPAQRSRSSTRGSTRCSPEVR